MIAGKQIKKIIILPFSMAILVPAILLSATGSSNPGMGYTFPKLLMPVMLGALLLIIGVVLLFSTIALFDKHGEGTLAPWDPTKKLVVMGPYQYVRNPMISGVIFILIGEAVIYGSWALFIWAAFFILINAIYIPLIEEPGMIKRFGKEYEMYSRHVPRWLPRIAAWHPDDWEEIRGIKQF